MAVKERWFSQKHRGVKFYKKCGTIVVNFRWLTKYEAAKSFLGIPMNLCCIGSGRSLSTLGMQI